VQITPNGVQSTFATLSEQNFQPEGLAFDHAGNLFVIAIDLTDEFHRPSRKATAGPANRHEWIQRNSRKRHQIRDHSCDSCLKKFSRFKIFGNFTSDSRDQDSGAQTSPKAGTKPRIMKGKNT
jgi:hypothetical protein